jgi:hypothetical protein
MMTSLNPNKNKTRKFILLSLLVVISRFYDVVTTYFYTPDLKNETNILVVFFGAEWTSVIITQSLLVGLIVLLLYYYLFKFNPTYPADKNLTLKQFSSYLYFNDTTSFSKLFYKLPNNKKTLLASTGYVVSMTLICVSLIVGTSTTFLLLSDKYQQLYKNGIQTSLFVIIVALALWFSIRFFKLEFRKYKYNAPKN